MTSVSVTVFYWHPQSIIVSNVYKTTGTEERHTHTTVYIIQNATLIKIQCSTVGFQGITNQRFENVSDTIITHVSIPC